MTQHAGKQKCHHHKKVSLISLLNSLPQIILLVLDLCVYKGNIHQYDQKIH